ncbi:polysialyltransferase family glycosyltransferase [Allobranchiibius sp. GilTou38]|uniref:polysialyltransferase family glycosyltransferase n=1 Tax=Allobranchiibius sp. GilTou38 TaxID=2815210 RepID=UPI001AA1AFC3|nr:polysialyltransferase family glycosyltransferase [Allobranchiibius sp. GilTou38]MBO1765694.1 hypothetical protein [Allobranchiibius sp. GilTou38]
MRVVVTGVRSRTHLVHVSAYLRTALDSTARGDLIDVGYLGGGTFLGSASVDASDVARLLPDDPRMRIRMLDRLEDWSPAGDELVYVAVGAPGIRPWIELRRRAGLTRIAVVVTDEGIGSYGTWRTRHDAWLRQGVREPWCTVRTSAVQLADRVLTTRRFAMYDAARDWALDPVIAEEFRSRTSEGDGDGADRVVLLTQPWVEMGALPQAAYLDHVAQVRDRVAATGRRLVVRPHPSEHPSRYDRFETLTGDLPAELDGRVVGSAAVLGGSSTALLNLAALHDLPARRLLVPGLEHLEERLGADQRGLLRRYLPAAVAAADLPAG